MPAPAAALSTPRNTLEASAGSFAPSKAVERLLPAFRRCVTPTSWRCRWAPARPRPSGRSIVARAVAAILDDPAPHIGHIYNLTGPESADLDHYARVFSEALGRTIRYRDASTSEWSEKLRAAGLPEHVVHHLTMTELHKQGRYNRMSEEYLKLTGEMPTSMADFVKLHATEFTRL
jgi:hypothetical protein